MKYLAGYPSALLAQVQQLVATEGLAPLLRKRYPGPLHEVQTDRALYDYVSGLKSDFMRKAPPLSKVAFDSKLHVIRNALGTHTTVSRVQGSKLKTKREIRVASLFREVPLEWLRMIVVHELAHMKERDHDKSFYALCEHMEPDYHRLEFDVRLYLTHLDSGGERLWASALPSAPAGNTP
ncbi:M48 family peptidase [Variovorax beijingensis]|uniref:M48 family peptidase n=1 Tax=Variovorax beijingensis TaxID=2496117 RepID=A0A3P3EYE9_9BURK|nr:M48 family metallopeptidase [Variovorax beijingensis]RRH91424.1 M48 family peptidase [Variovorax beijingensis]RSZ44690.1 M48 family peptidase [Variovorax beijingensis]